MSPDRLCEVGSDAFWRQPCHRKSHLQLLEQVPKLTPILGVPFFTTSLLCLDWLHICDLGVAKEFLGSSLKIFCGKLEGNFEEQCRKMYLRMKTWYNLHDVQSRLDQFKPSMLVQSGKPWPKLRAQGKAELWFPSFYNFLKNC